MNETLKERTIEDFGSQWTTYTDNDGYYGSTNMFQDICGPLLEASELKNKKIVDIGSGTGRIVNMMIGVGAGEVIAVEPSDAMTILKKNTAKSADKITYQNVPGDAFVARDVDYVFSIGVIHHIPEPEPVIQNAFRALKPDGKILIWLYGYEGNSLYLFFSTILRSITKFLPDKILAALCHALNWPLGGYIKLCRHVPLPMHHYMTSVLGKYPRQKRFLTIFDQLNPAYAKYYRKREAVTLLENAGFKDVTIYHRHGYSWTVIGTKP